MTRYALPCIVCDRQLRNVDETATNQPYNGTAFMSYGHYGSTIFDAMGDGTYLELNVCDTCLADKLGWVMEGKKTQTVEWLLTPWKPTDESIEYARNVARMERGDG